MKSKPICSECHSFVINSWLKLYLQLTKATESTKTNVNGEQYFSATMRWIRRVKQIATNPSIFVTQRNWLKWIWKESSLHFHYKWNRASNENLKKKNKNWEKKRKKEWKGRVSNWKVGISNANKPARSGIFAYR